MTYEEGKEIRLRWIEGSLAEYAGFCDAALPEELHSKYADDYRTRRHASGLADGLAMKRQSEVTA